MAAKTAEVEFRLLLDHEQFGKELQQEFIDRFAKITDCDSSGIKILSIRQGCINVRVRMLDGPAREFLTRFHELVEEFRDVDSFPPEFRDFFTKFKIDNFTRYVSDINIVVKKEPRNRAVIFVHGWSGDKDTFADWPDFLWDEFRCESKRYPYPTGAFAHSPSTIYIAEDLRNWVKNHFADSQLSFVAHSLGGLVVRRFVIGAFDRPDRLDLHVKNIAFMASPHNGLLLARAASKFLGVGSEQVQELSDNSPSLYELNNRWLTWVKSYVSNQCRLISFRGTKDKLVTSVGSVGLSEETVSVLGKDHENLVKPANPTDEPALTVRRFLVEGKFFDGENVSDGGRSAAESAFWKPLMPKKQTAKSQGHEPMSALDAVLDAESPDAGG